MLPWLYAAGTSIDAADHESPMPPLLLASLLCVGGAFAIRLLFAFMGKPPRRGR